MLLSQEPKQEAGLVRFDAAVSQPLLQLTAELPCCKAGPKFLILFTSLGLCFHNTMVFDFYNFVAYFELTVLALALCLLLNYLLF